MTSMSLVLLHVGYHFSSSRGQLGTDKCHRGIVSSRSQSILDHLEAIVGNTRAILVPFWIILVPSLPI